MAELVEIARPDHWFKNIFMLPGAALALVLANGPFPEAIRWLLLALLSTCLIVVLFSVDLPWLNVLVQPLALQGR